MSILIKHYGAIIKTQRASVKCSRACLSTKPAVKPTKEKTQADLSEYEKLSNVYTKVIKKKPQKPPFVKNIFVGRFDTDMLAYPEALDKEQQELLDRDLQPVRHFYDQWSNKGPPGMSQEYIANARQLQLFGQRTQQLLGGRELSVTETCRFGDVTSSSHGDINLTCSEQLGVQAILKLGTEKQQRKYLQSIASGKTTVAFCLAEADTSDLRLISTSATESVNHWILNGEKTWVVNGDTADLLVVIAKTEHMNKLGLKESKPTAFLVERTFGGVTSKPINMLGLHQTDISTVKFDNTKVPSENVIKEVHKGEEVISKILTEFRLSAGPACSTITRTVLNNFLEYCKQKSDDSNNLMELDLVRSKISEISASLYAMESMTYLTAALMDQYEDQDCEMEAAIVKAFSVEHCHGATLKCLSFLGSPSYMPDHWCNELHRNALSYLTLNEPIDNLKIIIALQGLQYAGRILQGEVRKLRNPMFHAGEILRRMFVQRRQVEDRPKLTLGLGNYLHPSAFAAAEWLEYCVLRMEFIIEQFLGRYGVDVVSKQMDLMRIADSIIDIYAMTASISRASRSYCIGLQHSDYEMVLANAFCLIAMERVKANLRKVFDGPYQTNDGNFVKIGEKLFQVGRYYPEHPLTKNF